MNRLFRKIGLLPALCAAAFTLTGALAEPAAAQGASYNGIARTADNTPLNNGMVAVCTSNPTNPGNVGQPCAPLATIYTDATLATPAQNPINADVDGNFSFWAPPGTYFIEFYSPLRASRPFTETVTLGCVPNSTAAGCGSGIVVDVRAYGAKCDDANDDTTAIQNAVNALPTTGAAIGGTVSFSGVCKTTASINVNTPNVTFVGTGHFQFITQNAPPSYIDFQGTTPQNAINVNAQGFAMDNLGVKYPTTIGGPLAPPGTPTLSQVTGSGCPAEPYYVQTTYVSAQGQTVDSPEATITTTSGNCLQVASPPPETGATGWNVYVSANPNNETKQTSSPLAIGTNWTFGGTLVNLGFRPAVDTTAYSAIYDPNGGQFDGVKLFTNLASSFGTASTANGYTSFGCCGKLHNVYIAGFGNGILGAGANNDFSITDSYIQANNVGAFIVNGADINIVRDDFEGNAVGNIKMLYGSPYTITQNYFEEESSPPSYNVQVGDTTVPPQGFTPTPGAVRIEGNFMQCNLIAYPPSPIVVDTSQVLDIERNSFSQCGNENIVDDLATSATAHITMLGNISDAQPLSWITHTTGLVESDVDGIGTAENPGTPTFYDLNIDSQPGYWSYINFNTGGSPAWAIGAGLYTFNFLNGTNDMLQLTPFGSQTNPSVLSNYAMASAEVIVTQSGNSATFDAGLGNTFELIMNANVTSSTLVNTHPGEWLDFIICQGGGGPWTFAWPSNVFGGGTVGTTIGPCSTQQFYVSGSNAWASGPMNINMTSGSTGLSLPSVSGFVPYYTGSWTSGDCLQAGGSAGLITLAAGACGTGGGSGTGMSVNGGGTMGSANFGSSPSAGANNLNVTWQQSGSNVSAELPVFGASGSSHSMGLVPDPGATAGTTHYLREDGTWDVPPGGGGSPGGTNTAVQFNSSGSFGGDATNFFYNSTSHNLTITGAMTTATNSFALDQLVNPGANGDLICGSSGAWADCTPGLQERSVTGTTDTIAAGDRGNMVTYNGTSAVAVTLPAASSFGNNFFFHVEAIGSGAPTFTPASGTINGSSSFTAPLKSFGTIYSPDNTNWTADFAPDAVGGTGPSEAEVVSAATNFGTNLTSQVIISSLTCPNGQSACIVFVDAAAVQSLAGVGCSSTNNTVSQSYQITGPGGNPESLNGVQTLTITGNGAVDSGAASISGNGQSVFRMVVKNGSSISYTTASSLGSTGCTTVPQYTVYARVSY